MEPLRVEDLARLLQSYGAPSKPPFEQLVSRGVRRRRARIAVSAAMMLAVLAVVPVVLASMHNGGSIVSVVTGSTPTAGVERSRLQQVVAHEAQDTRGTIDHADAVRTTLGEALQLTAMGTVASDASATPVWLIQVFGAFTCQACSVPSGEKQPQGHVLTIIVDASTFDRLGGGFGDTQADLSRVGTVLDATPQKG